MTGQNAKNGLQLTKMLSNPVPDYYERAFEAAKDISGNWTLPVSASPPSQRRSVLSPSRHGDVTGDIGDIPPETGVKVEDEDDDESEDDWKGLPRVCAPSQGKKGRIH
jgi:hypothetical protein